MRPVLTHIVTFLVGAILSALIVLSQDSSQDIDHLALPLLDSIGGCDKALNSCMSSMESCSTNRNDFIMLLHECETDVKIAQSVINAYHSIIDSYISDM